MRKRLFFRIAIAVLFPVAAAAIALELAQGAFPDRSTSQIRREILLAGALDAAHPVSQTFSPVHSHLSSITVFLRSNRPTGVDEPYRVWAELRNRSGRLIASNALHIGAGSANIVLALLFPPQADSAGKTYSLQIRTDAPQNRLAVWSSLADSYPGGTILLEGEPAPFDLTFRTARRPPLSYWLSSVFQANSRLGELLALCLIFGAFGLLVFALIRRVDEGLLNTALYSAGIGVGAAPILVYAFGLLRIRLDASSLLIAGFIVLALVVTKYRLYPLARRPNSRREWTEIAILIGMFLLAAISRVSQIQELIVPNWVDGVVHQGFMARALDRGGLRLDEIYPKGFHANVLIVHLLTTLPLPESTLLMGQCLSLLSGLAFYLPARRILRPPYSLIAAGLYWFLMPFPSYLITWGRYPLLQGLILISVGIAIRQERLPRPAARDLLTGVLSVALGLSYYGALLIFVAYLLAEWLESARRIGVTAALQASRWGLAIMLPVVSILAIRLDQAFARNIYGQDSIVTAGQDAVRAFQISMDHGGLLVWLVGALGLGLGISGRDKKLILLLKWILVLACLNLLQVWLGITVSSLANTVIFMSVPVALFAGRALRLWMVAMGQNFRRITAAALTFVMIAGAYNISGIVDPTTVLFLPADRAAMEWIGKNTAPESVFVIDSFRWGDEYAPSDGGGWIRELANRETTLFDPESFEFLLEDQAFDYLYLGRAFGLIDQRSIGQDARFISVYERDGIRIYRYAPLIAARTSRATARMQR